MQKYGLILDQNASKHPAWDEFMRDMNTRAEFSLMGINLAWAFFKQGWDACKARMVELLEETDVKFGQ